MTGSRMSPRAIKRAAARRRSRKQANKSSRSSTLLSVAALAGAGVAGTAASADAATFSVDTTADGAATAANCGADGVPNPAPCSLRDAVAATNAAPNAGGADQITFESSLSGSIDLTQGQIQIASGEPVSIEGPGADQLAVDAQGTSRIFYLDGVGAPSYISGLGLAGGKATGFVDGGGAIFARNSPLTVERVESVIVRGELLRASIAPPRAEDPIVELPERVESVIVRGELLKANTAPPALLPAVELPERVESVIVRGELSRA